MSIGINLTKDIKVELGEIKEKLFKDLNESGLNFDVPFDKVNENNIKETLVHIKDLGIEISVENDIIKYIKSGNTPFTCVDIMANTCKSTIEHIQNIKDKVQDMFSDEEYNIKIEKLDTETMNITLILSSKFERVRIHILKDSNGAIFINTLRSIAQEG